MGLFDMMYNAVYGRSERQRDAIIEAIDKDENVFKECKWKWRKDREVLGFAVKKNPRLILSSHSKYTEKRRDFIDIAMMNGMVLEFASDEIKNDKGAVSAAVNQNGLALKFAGRDVLNDVTTVSEAAHQNGLALKYLPEGSELLNNFKVVEWAVKQNGLALKYASKDLKNDRELVYIATKQNPMALQFVGEDFKKDREFVEPILKREPNAIRFVDYDFIQEEENADLVIDAIKKKPALFNERNVIPTSYKHLKNLVKKVVKADGRFYKDIFFELKNNMDILLVAMHTDVSAFKYADESLRKDKKSVLEIIKFYPKVYPYLDPEFKGDKEILEAVADAEEIKYVFKDGVYHPENEKDKRVDNLLDEIE